MAPPFTFLNVSNAPGLGPKEAKQMRAHITKTNFAKRRQRLAKERQSNKITQWNKDLTYTKSDEGWRLMQKWVEAALDPGSDSLLTSMVDPIFSPIGYLLHDFRPLIFPAGTGAPGSVREKEWVDLLESEPALVEASVSIALRHCPKYRNTWGPREAAIRKGRAIKLINQRLDTPAGLTDGILSAVFTLTYAELLGSDTEARNVHIQGLAQMVRMRRSSGTNTIPLWFCDFLLYDSIGHTIFSANYSNLPLIQALRNEDDPDQADVAKVRLGINELCRSIDEYYASSAPRQDVAIVIGFEVERLQFEIDTLLGNQENYIRSLHDSLHLFLLLLWPIEEPSHLEAQAEKLKYALLQPHIRLCSSVQLLVWQLFVGASAAKQQSETLAWYIIRLRELLNSMNVTGWDMTLEILTRAFAPDARLLNKFKTVWQKVYYS